tara:strand:+ start:40244 stop:40654 length:411 start_codon:yes stop_codon:yes gene_type:complete
MKGGIILLLMISFCGEVAYADKSIKPFTSDGCSAFPDGTPDEKHLWLDCCVAHDLSYWQGGSRAERKAADQALRTCVEQVGKPAIASLMLTGVRVGGTPYLPTTFRWGYGWPYLRGYKPVTSEEKKQIEQILDESR